MASAEELQTISHLPGSYQSLLISIAPYAGLPLDQVNKMWLI